MKIVIAPDSFKGSLTAFQAAKAIDRGIKKVDTSIETALIPLADGGEGTIDSILNIYKGKLITCKVHNPIGQIITSNYAILEDQKTAVIEMASASGILLLKDHEKNPLITNTIGTGELIIDALNKGCKKIIIGLGGSATNDCGSGMAYALGFRFLDENRNQIFPSGQSLSKIKTIDFTLVDSRLKDTEFMVITDVDNPLCGDNGATYIYAPQKGALKKDLEVLEHNMYYFGDLLEKQFDKKIKTISGSGAAGGLGAGIIAFLNITLQKGIEVIAKITNLKEDLKNADLVITGEGSIDFQTIHGKTPYGVAMMASENKIPTIGIAGSLGKNYQILYNYGFSGLFSIINKPMSLQKAIENAETLLENKTENIIRFWLETKIK